jgi:hypothetical protein
MGDDAPAGMPFWHYEPSNSRRIVEPRLMVVTICNDNERWPDMKSPNGGLTFRIRPSPPPGCQLRWAAPGIQGAVATLEIMLGHTVSTLDDLCYFLYLHAYCRAVFLAAAQMAIRRGHAPKEWLKDVLHAAYVRTRAELAKGDWRATIADAHGYFGAWLRSFALNRCREALRAQRFAQGFASRSDYLQRIEVTDAKYRNHPAPPARPD